MRGGAQRVRARRQGAEEAAGQHGLRTDEASHCGDDKGSDLRVYLSSAATYDPGHELSKQQDLHHSEYGQRSELLHRLERLPSDDGELHGALCRRGRSSSMRSRAAGKAAAQNENPGMKANHVENEMYAPQDEARRCRHATGPKTGSHWERSALTQR